MHFELIAGPARGIYYNTLGEQTYFWIGNTSRDQYSGVMFGLSVAYGNGR